MAIALELITNAFYLAKVAGLSKQGGQTPSLAQQTDGLNILNVILDSLSLDAAFNSFLYQLTIPSPSTQDIFIGRNLIPPNDTTIVDADPFKLLFGASISVPMAPYPLILISLSQFTQTPFAFVEGSPGYLYWGLQEQDGNIYTHLKLYPSPNQTGDLSLVGTRVLPGITATTANILPTFFAYLKYRVAEELAAQYGTMDIWNSANHEKRMKEYEDTLAQNSPVDGTSNDLTSLLNRQYYGNYPWF